MNTPNKLTILRVLMVPVFMVFVLYKQIPYNIFIALAVFAIASITDLIDGKLARKNNQITNFGKLMDPLADKLLVTAALVCFVQLGLANVWAAMIIIAREFLVTSIRLIAVDSGKVIAANIWGKTKTVSQMIAVIVTLFCTGLSLPPIYGSVLIWIAAGFTIISGVQYTWAYREYITTTK